MLMSDSPKRAASDSWQAVPSDIPRHGHISLPLWAKITGIVVLVLLVVGGGLLGVWIAGGGPDGPIGSSTPRLPLKPPVQVGDFVAGEVSARPTPSSGDKENSLATYSNGTEKVAFYHSWPESDLGKFVKDAGIKDAEQHSEGVMCGKFVDNDRPACGRITDGSGLILMAVSDLDADQVAKRLGEFEQALKNQ